MASEYPYKPGDKAVCDGCDMEVTMQENRRWDYPGGVDLCFTWVGDAAAHEVDWHG